MISIIILLISLLLYAYTVIWLYSHTPMLLMMNIIRFIIMLITIVLTGLSPHAEAPPYSEAGHDSADLGRPQT